jgi:hypothetical protein
MRYDLSNAYQKMHFLRSIYSLFLNDSENYNAKTKVRTLFYPLSEAATVPHTLRTEHCPFANFEINKECIYFSTTRRRADDIFLEEFMPPALRLQK